MRADIIADREQEMKAYDAIWSQIDPDMIVTAPDYVSVEGAMWRYLETDGFTSGAT